MVILGTSHAGQPSGPHVNLMKREVAGVWAPQGHGVFLVLNRRLLSGLNDGNCGAGIQPSELLVKGANQLTGDDQDHAEVDLLKRPSVAGRGNSHQHRASRNAATNLELLEYFNYSDV